jgi:hypothetical protein
VNYQKVKRKKISLLEIGGEETQDRVQVFQQSRGRVLKAEGRRRKSEVSRGEKENRKEQSV